MMHPNPGMIDALSALGALPLWARALLVAIVAGLFVWLIWWNLKVDARERRDREG